MDILSLVSEEAEWNGRSELPKRGSGKARSTVGGQLGRV